MFVWRSACQRRHRSVRQCTRLTQTHNFVKSHKWIWYGDEWNVPVACRRAVCRRRWRRRSPPLRAMTPRAARPTARTTRWHAVTVGVACDWSGANASVVSRNKITQEWWATATHTQMSSNNTYHYSRIQCQWKTLFVGVAEWWSSCSWTL